MRRDASCAADDDKQLPRIVLGLTMSGGFLCMLLLEQAQNRLTGHTQVLHEGHLDHLSDAEDGTDGSDRLGGPSPHSTAGKLVRRADAGSATSRVPTIVSKLDQAVASMYAWAQRHAVFSCMESSDWHLVILCA